MTAKPTVLLVEDVDEQRRVVRGAIEQLFDCQVLEARDGVEGAVLAVTYRPDAIITDLDMPRMGGLELVAFIRRCPTTAAIPMIVLTLRDGAGDRVDVSDFGILARWRKPVGAEQLRQGLEAAGLTARIGSG